MSIRNDWSPLVFCFLRVQQEDALAQAAFEEARRRTRDFEDRDRSHREDLEVGVAVSEDEFACAVCVVYMNNDACLKSNAY